MSRDSSTEGRYGPGSLRRIHNLQPLSVQIPSVVSAFAYDGAMGLILVDATALMEIDRVYGTGPFGECIETLVQRVETCVLKEFDEELATTLSVVDERQIALFLYRDRRDVAFYTEVLPHLVEVLRGYLPSCLKRLVYPYLARAPEIPVGHSIGFFRKFQSAEIQVHRLVDAARETARYENERVHRERAAALRKIIFEQAIWTVYQPIVNLASREVIGFEALSRGPFGTGLENPTVLFEVADTCDMDYELDKLCRRRALRNATEIGSDSKLFLNILPTSIHDPDFTEARVRQILGEVGIAPSNLVLEISERQAIANYSIFREAIERFSMLGFQMALDDVGSGHNSLEAALELSPHFLKIDMSIVRGIEGNPHKQEMLIGLQRVAQRMHSQVIAEGIETEAELETLVDLGIDLGQGFLLDREATRSGACCTSSEDSEDENRG